MDMVTHQQKQIHSRN